MQEETIIQTFNMLIDRLHSIEMSVDKHQKDMSVVLHHIQKLSMTESDRFAEEGCHRLCFMSETKIRKNFEGNDASNCTILIELDNAHWFYECFHECMEFDAIIREKLTEDAYTRLDHIMEDPDLDRDIEFHEIGMERAGHLNVSEYLLTEYLKMKANFSITRVKENEPSMLSILTNSDNVHAYELVEGIYEAFNSLDLCICDFSMMKV